MQALQGAVSIVHRLDGTVLAVYNQKYKGWVLPGGKVEPDEVAERAQYRELLEETGLVTVFASLVYTAQSHVESKREVFVYLVAASGTPEEKEAGSPVCWMTPKELVYRSPFGPWYKTMFEEILNETQKL